MTLRDYTANVISATKVVPDGNFKTSAASGVWDINEALDLIKSGNWPNAANLDPSSFVDGLFQTHLYTGNDATRSITNDINLSGKGGLVWFKSRTTTTFHGLFDTERGATKRLRSDSSNAEDTLSSDLTAFNSDGFTLGNGSTTNTSPRDYVSWTFRKQPKFFDIVTYTGNGTAGRTVSHNLGSVPGMIIVKSTSNAESWYVYHRGVDATAPEDYFLELEKTAARTNAAYAWNDTAPTSTEFTVGTVNDTNQNGATFVAYLFAHNNDDGGFGEPGDQDIIKCGSYTGNGSGQDINLGFEAQWVMIKPTSTTGNWTIMDVMRNMPTTGIEGRRLQANTSSAEGTANYLYGMKALETGFTIDGLTANDYNKNGETYIYMAIRRGGMQTPSTASDVFAIDTQTAAGPAYTSGFVTDAMLRLNKNGGSSYPALFSRLTHTQQLVTSSTAAETTQTNMTFDFMEGVGNSSLGGTTTNAVGLMWKRARGYFDIVAYTGNGTSGNTISHNLGVAPEMMWVKNRDTSYDWFVYHKDLDATAPEDKYLRLNKTSAVADTTAYWNDTAPTASVFSLGNGAAVNANNEDHISYLFATLSGVSKVGSFTQSGATNVDCGFTGSTPSLIIIKRTDSTGDWYLVDSERGIVTGNDPYLLLNSTAAEVTNTDIVDPYSGGFATTSSLTNGSYIFYAIAATS